ncbi:hypothetical protein PS15m_004656 [Mucor circinelloides]
MHDLEVKIRQERSTEMFNVYIDDQKAFIYFRKIKLLSAAVAGRRAGIVERTAQTWAKRLDNDLNYDIFERKPIRPTDLRHNYEKSTSIVHQNFLMNTLKLQEMMPWTV